MEKYKVYLKKFKIALVIFVVTLILLIFFLSKIFPQFQKITSIQDEYKNESATLTDLERKLSDLKSSLDQKQTVEENTYTKVFFRPINSGMDTESSIADEFAEILQIIRENKIKTRSIKYEYDPQDDNFVKHVGNRYHVCRVSMEMVANYNNLENLLKDLYKHEHFLDIYNLEVIPYQKNKRILLVNLQIKLYAQKDGSSSTVESSTVESSPVEDTTSEQKQPATDTAVPDMPEE